jgi:tricorn protease
MKKCFFIFAAMAFLLSGCPRSVLDKDSEVAEKTIKNQRVKTSEIEKSLNTVKNENNKLNWLRYPAISPDGQEIAFSYKGNIYVSPVNGGFARALTKSESFESRPIWSPDSSKIAFLSDRTGNHDIFVVSLNGGEAKRLTYHSANDYPMAFSKDSLKVYFSSARLLNIENSAFPSRGMPQLFSVPVEGGNSVLEMGVPVFDLFINNDGKRFIYHDKKGYENEWRKHHKSSVTRDIWEYNTETDKFSKLTQFEGEDRSPVFSVDESAIYYLSEGSGSFNVWKMDKNGNKTQLTSFENHPVRFLSISKEGKLCFSYHGQIYTMKEGSEPEKLEIFSPTEKNRNEIRMMLADISEFDLNPDGMEAVFISRGEIYAVNPETGTTKRITETPGEERSVSFNPDGRKILYSSFRNGSWNIYETEMKDNNELYFFTSTKLEEKPIIETDFNTFQPTYSPDGKKIAYLRERTELVVYDTDKKTHVTVLERERNISYVDGDQQYQWSPDSTKIAVVFLDRDLWSGEIGIVNADGRGEVINVTNTGMSESNAKWSSKGEMVSWLMQNELFALFMNKAGLDEFNLSKEEFDLLKKRKEKEEKAEKPTENKPENNDKKEEKPPEPVNFENERLNLRTVKLSLNPANILDHTFSKDDETLFVLTMEPTEYRVTAITLREKKDNTLVSIPRPRNQFWWYRPNFQLILDKTGTSLYLLADKKLSKITVADGKRQPINPAAEFSVDFADEKMHLFGFVWKTVNDKFYVKELHDVNWKKYYNEYVQFIPHINNNYDFTEMLSEMLGELNVSHTGSGYIHRQRLGDDTGRLGIFYSYSEKGIVVDEVMETGPLDKADSKIKPGVIIEKIDGEKTTQHNIDKLLNRKVGKNVRLSLKSSNGLDKWEEIVRPINYRGEYELLYYRWVERNRKRVDELSGNRLGYVHIRGMNQASFRDVYNDILGRYNDREGIVIDTRFNGGGWLHNELSILFGGKEYTRYSHRGVKNFGGDPNNQWTKKSILVVNEGNYSDAHLFPYAYRTLELGKIVGMPVPGTSTAVWWPSMLDESMYFGIPQIGIKDLEGEHLENKQLEPDYLVPWTPEEIISGKDPQIEKAVKVLLEK